MLAHINAVELDLKFNKKFDEDLPSYYSQEFLMSKRQEFFKGYILSESNTLRHKMLPVYQNIIYHICVVLSEDQKLSYIDIYLNHHNKKISAHEFKELLQPYLWKLEGKIQDVQFHENAVQFCEDPTREKVFMLLIVYIMM